MSWTHSEHVVSNIKRCTSTKIAKPTKIITAVLSLDGWSSSTPSTQSKTATGVTSDGVCMIDLNMEAIDANSVDDIQEAWAHVDKIITNTNQITAYCYGQIPAVHIPIKIVVFD